MQHEALARYLDGVERAVLAQDAEHRWVFRYDSIPHFPGLASFPHYKHLPTEVVDSGRPDIEFFIREAATP
ncbi:MAG: DUF6516 family protein [Thiotrichales bacterium]